jgi:type II secretory pathway component GspD/PulD (secretin)/tetratricopeptide (TPR) repeat protein
MDRSSIARHLAVLGLAALLGFGCASEEPAAAPDQDQGPAQPKPEVRKGPGPLLNEAKSLDLRLKEQPAGEEGDLKPSLQGPGLDSRYASVEAERGILEQQNEYVSRALTEEGKKLLERAELEKAYKVFAKAAELNPGNEEAKTLLARTGAMTGRREHEEDVAFRDSRERLRVKIDEAMVEVRVLYEKSRNHYQRGEYEESIDGFERILNIIRWMPYHVDFSGYRDTTEAFLKAAFKMKRERDLQIQRRRETVAKQLAIEEEKERNERLHGTIALLASNAHIAFTDERYEECERLCRQILRLDPYNTDARELMNIAVESRHLSGEDKSLGSLREEWKKTFEEMEMAMVPQVDVISFPSYEEWREVDERAVRIREGRSGGAEINPQVDKIKNILRTKTVSLDFMDTPLKAVVSFLKEVSGINMIVDPKVFESKSEDELMIQLKVEEVPLGEALSLILGLKGLAHTIESGILLITTQEGAQGQAELRVIDIRDLMVKLDSFPGVDIKLRSGAEEAMPPMIEEPEATDQISGDTLVALIKENISPETWDTPPNQISHRQGNLIIRNQPAVLTMVMGLLENLRSQAGLLVTVESRFLTVEDNFLEDIGVDLRGLGNQLPVGSASRPGLGGQFVGSPGEPLDDIAFGSNAQPSGRGTNQDAGVFFDQQTDGDVRSRVENLFDQSLGDPNVMTGSGGMSLQYVFLDDVQLEAIFRAVRKTERINMVTAPRITAFNTQRVNISLLNQIAYVRDFDVEVAQMMQIGDPVVGRLEEGVILDVTPVVSANRRYITLELRPTVAKVVRPIPTFQSTLGTALSTPVFLHLPELKVQKVQTTVTVPDGGTIMLGGMKLAREEDLKSEVPFLHNIPILNFFLSRKGRFHMRRNLVVLVKAEITMLEEQEALQTQ